jgi:hypothetical protein
MKLSITIYRSTINKIYLKLTNLNENFYAVFSFILPLSIYTLTTARTITSYADSAELISAAFNLDAAHPPGYPLYILLGKLFTLIPLGSIAFRVNFLSCVLGALTIFFIYKIFQRLGLSALSSFIASQLLAFQYSFWLYSITAEVYSLNNLFAVILIYLSILWAQKTISKESKGFSNSHGRTPEPPFRARRPGVHTLARLNISQVRIFGGNQDTTRILYLLAFIFGLALSHHTSILLLAPGLFYVIWFVDRSVIFKKFTKLLFLFLLGFSPYIFLIYSSQTPHYPIFGNIPTPTRLIAYITRADYGGFFSAGPNISPDITGIRELSVFYFKLLFSRFTPIAPLLAFYFALSSLAKKQIIFRHLSITLFFSALFFPLFSLRKAGLADLHSQGVIERFALLGLLILGITFLLGLYWLISNYKLKKREPLFQITTLALVAFLLISNFSAVNKSNFNLSKNYALNILNQVEPDSIIFTSDDMTIFSLLYFVNAEEIKPNIILINTDFLENVAYQKEVKTYWPELFETDSTYSYDVARDIINKNQGKRPVYFVMLKDPYPLGFDGNPYYLNPMGLVLKADTSANLKTLNKDSLINYWNNYDLSGLERNFKDPFAQLAKKNYAFRAEVNTKIYYKAGCVSCAQQDISALSTFSADPEKLKDSLSSLQLPQPQPTKNTAQNYLASAQEHLSQSTDLFYLHRAIWDLQRALELEPENQEARTLLTELFASIGL